MKWEAVAKQPVQPHYFVCNADESEPGTFKDRVLMEHDPFAVLESLTIAGYATGSEKGFIYIRGEYPLATSRLEHAIELAYAHGFLGADVMGEGFAFDVELRRGAGAYICGEETSLFNSIEGKRGEPRNKPPFPVERGRVRQADRDQQRRDARERARGAHARRRGVRRRSGRRTPRDHGCSASPGCVERARRVRGRARHHAARAARDWPAACGAARR